VSLVYSHVGLCLWICFLCSGGPLVFASVPLVCQLPACLHPNRDALCWPGLRVTKRLLAYPCCGGVVECKFPSVCLFKSKGLQQDWRRFLERYPGDESFTDRTHRGSIALLVSACYEILMFILARNSMILGRQLWPRRVAVRSLLPVSFAEATSCLTCTCP
jgi:hypothetical protein